MVSNASLESLGGLALESDDRRDGVRFNLAGGSWAVVRMSGTEPLVRVHAETPDTSSLDAVLRDLRSDLGVSTGFQRHEYCLIRLEALSSSPYP
mgnify:FL=1